MQALSPVNMKWIDGFLDYCSVLVALCSYSYSYSFSYSHALLNFAKGE
jgi:hypothetical protein